MNVSAAMLKAAKTLEATLFFLQHIAMNWTYLKNYTNLKVVIMDNTSIWQGGREMSAPRPCEREILFIHLLCLHTK